MLGFHILQPNMTRSYIHADKTDAFVIILPNQTKKIFSRNHRNTYLQTMLITFDHRSD